MHFIPLAASLLFMSSIGLAASDAAAAAQEERKSGWSSQRFERNSQKQTLAYGKDQLQRVDFWAGAGRNAPLVVFVHGGGWKRGDKRMMDGSAKLKHWQELGYAVASVNYRLVPDNSVEDQAADVAAAVAHLKSNARRLGFDDQRIALIGHSAGAHLVALVGTDPAYFRTAGLSLNDVVGVIPLDGAAYDVAYQLEIGAPLMHKTYVQAFGNDPARHRKLSPTLQANGPNAPEFLILHVQRQDAIKQSKELGEALRKSGTPAKVQGFPGRGLRGHAQINRQLGEKDYAATQVVDTFLRKVFG
jgi:acetyl esterase/lipase